MATVKERRRFLEHATGKALSDSTVGRLLKRMGFNQKSEYGALEWDGVRRAAWRVMVSARVERERFVFVDKMGANTSLSVLRAWSRRGQ